ncbi:hypothetical protein TWF128_001841 [Orbilia oligospora]|nr:hypothetical protein TWF128_001841 [Orbilia oligospora]
MNRPMHKKNKVADSQAFLIRFSYSGWNSSNWIPPFVLDQPKSTDSICNHDKDSIFILRDATSVQRNEPIHQHKQLQDHVINLQFVQLHPAQGYQPV